MCNSLSGLEQQIPGSAATLLVGWDTMPTMRTTSPQNQQRPLACSPGHHQAPEVSWQLTSSSLMRSSQRVERGVVRVLGGSAPILLQLPDSSHTASRTARPGAQNKITCTITACSLTLARAHYVNRAAQPPVSRIDADKSCTPTIAEAPVRHWAPLDMALPPKVYTLLCGCFAALGSVLFG